MNKKKKFDHRKGDENLYKVLGADVRAELTSDLLFEVTEICLEDIRVNLDDIMVSLKVRACKLADEHYAYRKQLEKETGFRTRFATRVAVRDTGLSCLWFYNGFMRGEEDFDEPYFKPVPKRCRFGYSKAVFRGTHPDELKYVTEIEEKYKVIAEAVALLKEMQRDTDKFYRRVSKLYS